MADIRDRALAWVEVDKAPGCRSPRQGGSRNASSALIGVAFYPDDHRRRRAVTCDDHGSSTHSPTRRCRFRMLTRFIRLPQSWPRVTIMSPNTPPPDDSGKVSARLALKAVI